MSNLLSQASLVMIPSGYKEDVVYSAVPTNGNGDLSFTRASNGTRVNSAGLVEVVAWNLLSNSEEFTTGNGWFANTTGGSTATQTSNYGVAPNGTTTADRIQLALNGQAYADWVAVPTLPIIVGQTYTYSIYIKSLSGTKTLKFFNDNSVNVTKTITTDWVRYDYSWTASSTSIYPRFLLDSTTSSSADLLAWGTQINIGSTAKPYFPTTDRLNVPRLTYQNGGGGCPSLLLEKQSTNLVTYSEQFDNASWSKIDNGAATTPVVTANYTTSPDGTQNADRVQFARTGTADSVYSLLISNTCNTSATSTYTMYVKSLTSSTQNLLVYWGGGAGQVFQVTTEWTRITLSNLPSASQQMVIGTRGGTGNYYNGGDLSLDIAVWGAQVEQSSYPTSYIPTTSSSATRVADACFKTGISSLIGQTSGVLFVDFYAKGSYDSNNLLMLISSGSGGEIIYLNLVSGTIEAYIAASSTQQFLYTGTTALTANTRHKLAIAYASNDIALYHNGTQLATDTSASIPACSLIRIGDFLGGLYQFGNTINEAVLFSTRLTNAELASLTTI